MLTPQDNNPEKIMLAVNILRAAGLVAFPTETVYGLGADASNFKAVEKIFLAKGRPKDHPVIVHIASAAKIEEWAKEIPDNAFKVAETCWPGPLTLILKKQPWVLDIVTAGQTTVGLRVPNHKLALTLLKAFDGGIAAPSANRFGYISPTSTQHVFTGFGKTIDLILDGGNCQIGLESTILDFSTSVPKLLRLGSISQAELESCLNQKITQVKQGFKVSGMLKTHYAPITPTYLVNQLPKDINNTGVVSCNPFPNNITSTQVIWKQLPSNPKDYAKKLYAALHELDSLGVKSIFVEQVPNTPTWQAIRDRLKRASSRQ